MATVAFATYAQAEISQVNTMNEVITSFKEADQQTLALFDIDMVILQPQDPAFQMGNMKRFSPICKKVIRELPSEKIDLFFILSTLSSEPALINQEMPAFLEDLRKRQIPMMALTGNFTGKFDNIENMEEWKIKQLAKMDIHFSRQAPHEETIVFCDLPSYRQNYSTYTKGILFVNGSTCPKGEALIAFLKKTNRTPKKVIFIDDREDNLKSVEASLKQLDPAILFIGLHFTGAKDYPSTPITEQLFESRWREIASQALKFD